MIIIGIIALIAGAGLVIFGISQNNSLEAQLTSFLQSGSSNPGTIWIIIGVIAIIVGAVVIYLGVKKKNS